MTRRPTAFVLGASADIGAMLCMRLLAEGWDVVGTGRAAKEPDVLRGQKNFYYIRCDVAKDGFEKKITSYFKKSGKTWSLFVSCVGTMEPIGPFFSLDFDAWEQSVRVNSLAQLRALHALWNHHTPRHVADVMLMAGGGTNNPFTNYSAYCVAKIALIKMAELLDDEEKNMNIFIIGPGYVRTKIHDETLRAGKKAGGGYSKTLSFLKTLGTPMEDIYAHMLWCMKQGRKVAGGRNFSTQHDPWKGPQGSKLAVKLAGSADGYRLRRQLPLSKNK